MVHPLITAIRRSHEGEVVDLLRGLSETDRRARAPELLKLAKLLWNGREMRLLRKDGSFEVISNSADYRVLHRWNEQLQTLTVALLGTGSLTELRRVGRWPFELPEESAAVLIDRKPPWLDQLAQRLLETDPPHWELVHGLVRAGAIERPSTPEYIGGLLWQYWPDGLEQEFARDPALLTENVWDVIAHTGAVTSQRTADAGWRAAIFAATQDGRLPRDGVLDAVLDALASDLTAYQSSWHTAFWKELEPTADERTARIGKLCTLLGAAAEPIVGFAVDELNRAQAQVDPRELTGALSAPAKKTVRAALKLLDRRPDAAAATIALGHPAADVQKLALDRLERWGLTDEARDALLRMLDLVAATQRPRAEALLGLAMPADDEEATPEVGHIPEYIRAALNFGGPVPEAPVPGEPVLGTPVPPITTLDELVSSLAEALSGTVHYDDDRVLDGVQRLCHLPFEGPLTALERHLCDWTTRPWTLRGVLEAWRTRTLDRDGGEHMVLHRRTLAVAERVARAEAGPLLAMPTHEGGWIAPQTLVERLGSGPVDEIELAQALLRLAPGDASIARDLPGRTGALVRCALGGEEVPDDGPAAIAAHAAAGIPELRLTVRVVESDFPAGRLRIARTAYHQPGLDPVGEQIRSTAPREFERHYVMPERLGWPRRRDVACAGAICHIGWNLVPSSSDYNGGAAALLELLLGEREPLPPLALQMATLALCSSFEREHLLATDLLIAGIADGRIDAAGLIPGLRDGLDVVVPNRLGPRLRIVSEAGPLHRAVIRDTFDGLVDRLADFPTRTYVALLEPFDELCAQTGTRVEHSRAFLETLTGSSKAAKAARSLLARDGEPPPSERDLLLAARVRRAERWLTG